MRTRVVGALALVFAVMLAMLAYMFWQEWQERLGDARERVVAVAGRIALQHQQIVTRADGVLTLLSRSPTAQRFDLPAACSEFLAEGRRLWPAIGNLAAVRPDGDIVCDSNASNKVVNIARRSHFQKALVAPEAVAIGNVITNPLTGKQGLPFGKAVVDPSGRTVGVVMTLLDLTWLSDELGRSRLPEGARLALIDSRGVFLARHPDPEGWLGKSVDGRVLSHLADDADGGDGAVTDAVGMDGVRRIWAVEPFAATEAGPIRLVIGIPTQDVTADVIARIRVGAAMALALLLSMLWLVWAGTSRGLLAPVAALVTAARRLSNGDLAARSGLDRLEGELGELGRAFDVMANSVQTRECELAASRQSLLRANRALRTLSACNHELVHAASEAELLDSTCRLVVEKGGYLLAWVAFAEREPSLRVRTVAAAGDQRYIASVDTTSAGLGAVSAAMKSGSTEVINDLVADPAMQPWRIAAQEHGFGSNIALPLSTSAGMFGVLAIYAAEPNAFDQAEILLLEELSQDLAFGIHVLRTKAERDRMSYENRHHEEILRLSLEGTIAVLSATVERRDPYTAGHQKRVSMLAAAIAEEMGLDDQQIEGIRIASTVHDLGKIQVPSEILAKPSKLTALEYEMLKLHPEAGYEILKEVKFPWPIADMVRQHHERLDGSGYPQGLRGENILLEARIITVADVVEAMASHRPYRPALGFAAALAEVQRGKGTLFDPAAVNACVKLFEEGRFTFPNASSPA